MATYKTHIALRVVDLNRAIAFYRVMFAAEPVKHKLDYAKFEIENPGLNLTLNVSDVVVAKGSLSHLGIQVDSAEAIQAASDRFKAAGLNPVEEHNTDCCYALQDKVWLRDPDGNSWEIFVVNVADTAPEKTVGANSSSNHVIKTCCA